MKPMKVETDAEASRSSSSRYLKTALALMVVFLGGYLLGDSSSTGVVKQSDTVPLSTSSPSGIGGVDNPPSSQTPASQTPASQTPASQTPAAIVSTPPPTEPKPVNKVSRSQLEALREKAGEVRNMLDKYYRKARSSPLAAHWGYKNNTGEWKAMIESHSINLAMAIAHQRTYLAGMIGSSVAAGHDNCAYDSFEAQLERFMDPIMKIAGSGMTVLNAGEGGDCQDNQQNNGMCWNNLVGDVDLLFYSWSYFESRGSHPEMTRESLIRWAHASKNSPPVLAITMYKLQDDSCNAGHVTARERKKKGIPMLEPYYANYGYNSFCLHGALESIHPKNSAKHWNEVGDGIHNKTRYSDSHMNGTRSKSLGVVWRNWHPGPLGFQLAVDNVAYNFMEAIVVAIDKLEKALDAGKILVDEFPDGPEPPMLEDMKKVISWCESEYAPCKKGNIPVCSSWDLPQYGRKRVGIDPVDGDLNPWKVESGSGIKGWKHVLYPRKQLIPRAEKHIDICQHKDRCGGLRSTGPESGILAIRIPKVEVGSVIVCFHGMKGKMKDLVRQENIVFRFEDQVLDKEKALRKSSNKIGLKCMQVLRRYPDTMTNPTGHAYLGIEVNGTIFGGEKSLTVSQVIAY